MSNFNKATEDQVAEILKNQMETLIYIVKKAGTSFHTSRFLSNHSCNSVQENLMQK